MATDDLAQIARGFAIGAALCAPRRAAPNDRAFRLLADLLGAVTQAGPDTLDLDVDPVALAAVVHSARALLVETGRLSP